MTRSPSLSETQWAQLRAAFTAGAGLRPLAREAGIPEGTILARAKREGWSQAKRRARDAAEATQSRLAVPAAAAIANEAAGRAQRHVARMESLCESIGGHVETLPPNRLFESITRLDALDRLARRTHGLDTNNAPVVQVLFTGHEPAEPYNLVETLASDPSNTEWFELEE